MRRKNSVVSCLIIILAFLGLCGFLGADRLNKSQAKEDQPAYEPNSVLVKFKTDESPEVLLKNGELKKISGKYQITNPGRVFTILEGIMKQTGKTEQEVFKDAARKFSQNRKLPKLLQQKTPNLSRIYKFRIESGDPKAVAEELARLPEVEYAQPDYLYKATTVTPNDTYYNTSNLWGLFKIKAGDAWGQFPTLDDIGKNVVVAVVDTGADYRHPDLSPSPPNGALPNIWQNLEEDADGDGHTLEWNGSQWALDPGDLNGVDNNVPTNGKIDDLIGWDFSYGDNNPYDGHGHGSHVSGTILALTNNAKGIAGISWHSKVMVVKGLSDAGSGSSSVLADCIIYAALNGAQVINNSWGPQSRRPSDTTLENAVRQANNNLGCVVVFAAGNSYDDVAYYSPANMEEVLSVAATTSSDTKPGFSNFGEKISVSAPGTNILSVEAGTTGYTYYDGTSMAAPHVAGLAALLLSKNPGMDNDMVRGQIMSTTDNIDASNPHLIGKMGTGRINAYRALTAVPQPNILIKTTTVNEVVGNGNGSIDPGETISLVVELRNIWLAATNVQAILLCNDPYITIGNGISNYGNLATMGSASNTATPFTFIVDPSAPQGHSFEMTLNITADGGYSTTKTITLKVLPLLWPNEVITTISSSPPGYSWIKRVSTCIDTGDVTGDGVTDVVIGVYYNYSWANDSGFISIYTFNNGAWQESERIDDAYSVYHLRVANVDDDPGNEIIVFEESAEATNYLHISVFDKTGTGWQRQILKSTEVPQFVYSMDVGDADNDGRNEIVVGYTSNAGLGIHVFDYNDGVWSESVIDNTNRWWMSVNIVDADGDGANEVLASGYYNGDVINMYTYSSGSWLSETVALGDLDWIEEVHFGDIDFDTNNEIFAVGGYEGQEGLIYKYEDTGSSWLGSEVFRLVENKIRSVVLSDIDNDGQNELVIVFYPTTSVGYLTEYEVGYLEYEGGTYAFHEIGNFDQHLTWSSNALKVADVDSDGIKDVIVAYHVPDEDSLGETNFARIVQFWSTNTTNLPPNTPTDPNPQDNATGVSIIGTILSWLGGDPDTGDTVTYDLYFGNQTNPALAIANTTSTNYSPGTLNYNTTYYWKVKSWDNHGNWTQGPQWDFATESLINNPPYTPSYPNPLDNATGVPIIGTILSWLGGDPDTGDTVTYDLYFGNQTNPALAAANITDPSYALSTLIYNTTYYWYINATDNHGNWTKGPEWDFVTVNLVNYPPSTPSNPNPLDGATGILTTTNLDWADSIDPEGDPVKYDLYFGNQTSPSIFAENLTTSDYAFIFDELNHSTTYHWYVNATDNHGNWTKGPDWDFTTIVNYPPNTPSYPNPYNHATGVSIIGTILSWLGGDPNSEDTVKYDVYFGNQTNPALAIANTTSTNYSPGTLTYNTTYYWKVKVWDNHGNYTQGPQWDFVTRTSGGGGKKQRQEFTPAE